MRIPKEIDISNLETRTFLANCFVSWVKVDSAFPQLSFIPGIFEWIETSSLMHIVTRKTINNLLWTNASW